MAPSFIQRLGLTKRDADVLKRAYALGVVNITEMGDKKWAVIKRLSYNWNHSGTGRYLTEPNRDGDCYLTKRGRATAAAVCAWDMEWNRTDPSAGKATTEA